MGHLLRANLGLLIAKSESAEPVWNMIFPVGTWHGENLRPLGGSINFTPDVLREFVANWQAAGSPPLPLYLNHPSDDAKGEARTAERMAAGWILGAAEGGQLEVREDGLWAKMRLNEKARAAVKSDELRFLSPEWYQQHTDRRTGERRGWWLSGAALLNDPFFNSMPALAASHNPESRMDKKLIAAALGLPETATDEQINAKAANFKGDATASVEVGKLLAAVETSTKQNAELAKQVQELTAQKTAADIRGLEEKLVAEGRITPAQVKAGFIGHLVTSMGLAKAQEVMALQPPVVQMGELGVSQQVEDTGAKAATPKEAADKFAQLVDELESKEKVDVTVATKRVAAANPGLAKLAMQFRP